MEVIQNYDSQVSEDTAMQKILLMGMVSAIVRKVQNGQEYRDSIRIKYFPKSYEVFTVDHKHTEQQRYCNRIKNKLVYSFVNLPNHLNCTYESKRFTSALRSRFGDITFDQIHLDYFFSPVNKFLK